MNEYLQYLAQAFLVCVCCGLIYSRMEKISKIIALKKELAQEKEKLRLLNLLHPEPRCEDGWTFEYSPSTYFIGKNHKNGRGKVSICELSRSRDDKADIDYYGYRIASLLNQGYVTASPDPGVNCQLIKVSPEEKRTFDLIYEKLKTLGFFERLELTYCADRVDITFFSKRSHNDEVRECIIAHSLDPEWGFIFRSDKARLAGYNCSIIFWRSELKRPLIGGESKIKKCSKCINTLCLQDEEEYYRCDKNCWYGKPLASVEGFAESTDCEDYGPKEN